MKYSELVALSIEELKTKLAEEKAVLSKLKYTNAVTPLENPMRIRNTRRKIAQIATAIRAKEIAAQ